MVNVTRGVIVKLVGLMFAFGLFLVAAVLAPVEHRAGPGFIHSHPRHYHCLPCVIPLRAMHLRKAQPEAKLKDWQEKLQFSDKSVR